MIRTQVRNRSARIALGSLLALTALGALGGCVVVVHDYDGDDGWRSDDDDDHPMIGVHTDSVGGALAAQAAVDADDATLITRVLPGTPAEEAGLERFDLVVAINGDEDASPRRFRRAIRATPPGESITFAVLRNGERRDITLTPRPANDLRHSRHDRH